MNIIIPARKGSKGFPEKNRLLLGYTLDTIPKRWHENTIISTDDEVISEHVRREYPNIKIHERSDNGAVDTASTKECLAEVIDSYSLSGVVVMLYLTYPERTWGEVMKAVAWFEEKNAKSLLCKEDVKTHPYMCIYDEGDKGKQIIKHDLYRRQDYPACFKISHFISAFRTEELEALNQNLYNEDTYFYEIPKSVDIDYKEDYEIYKSNS